MDDSEFHNHNLRQRRKDWDKEKTMNNYYVTIPHILYIKAESEREAKAKGRRKFNEMLAEKSFILRVSNVSGLKAKLVTKVTKVMKAKKVTKGGLSDEAIVKLDKAFHRLVFPEVGEDIDYTKDFS